MFLPIHHNIAQTQSSRPTPGCVPSADAEQVSQEVPLSWPQGFWSDWGRGATSVTRTLSQRGWRWASANTGRNKSPTGQRQNLTFRAAASGTSQVYQASLWKGTSVALRHRDAARPPRPSSHLCAFRTESRVPCRACLLYVCEPLLPTLPSLPTAREMKPSVVDTEMKLKIKFVGDS